MTRADSSFCHPCYSCKCPLLSGICEHDWLGGKGASLLSHDKLQMRPKLSVSYGGAEPHQPLDEQDYAYSSLAVNLQIVLPDDKRKNLGSGQANVFQVHSHIDRSRQ